MIHERWNQSVSPHVRQLLRLLRRPDHWQPPARQDQLRPHLRTAVGPEATEDLLPQFHHPTVAFREVVGEGHTRTGEKAQYLLFTDTQAQQQIMIDPPRRPRALPLPTARSSGLCLMGLVSF